jgi:hypothetical protein
MNSSRERYLVKRELSSRWSSKSRLRRNPKGMENHKAFSFILACCIEQKGFDQWEEALL